MQVSLLMPQYRTSDLDRLVAGLLADDVMDTWSDNLNTIIDTLKPEGAGPREPGPRTATLHSEVTRETVVLHAANEDEVEDVLVVNEEQGGEEAGPAPAPQQQSPVMRGQAKPPTYVPIPSRKEKHRPSSSVAPAWVLPQLSPPPRPAPAPLQPKPRSPPKLEHKPRLASTRVSRVEARPPPEPPLAPAPPRPQPRTTEIRPVHAGSQASTSSLGAAELVARTGPSFPCPVCHEVFLAQDIMETHMKLHSDKHKCHTCGLVFIKARELIEHQRIHSGAKLVKCNICDKDFTEKGLRLHSERFHKILEVKTHNKRTSKENISYSEDKITFTSSSEGEDSDNGNPDDPGEASSEEEEEELKHKKARASNVSASKRTELCDLCDKYFTLKGLKLHKMRYHKSPNKDEALKKLVKAKKNPPLKKLFSCGFCEKKFSHLASMKVHEKVHLGGNPHQCDMCDAKFSNKFDLFTHERSHSAARPHKCDECTETFKTAESLRFHKLIHEASQPNVCQFCKKTFKNKKQLELHERAHVGEKPFNCNQCDQSFETASKLTRHITSTHMIRK